MFKKFTPRGIFAACFIFGLFVICVWNFPIHNYDYDDIRYSYECFPTAYKQSYIDMETKYLTNLIKNKKDKDYKELVLNKIISLQSDINSRLKYAEELLAIDMAHDPSIVYSIITDYLLLEKYDKALEIAQNTKLAENSCYKKSKTVGEFAYCRANIHYIKFLKDWYANEISCHITKSACYDTLVYQQYKKNNNFDFNRQHLIEHASNRDYVKNLRNSGAIVPEIY